MIGEMTMKVLVSACLNGVCCRYDGSSADINLGDKYPQIEFVPVCPEVMAGLTIPRNSVEITNGRIVDNTGTDLTKAFTEGANKALAVALKHQCHVALLKSKSPSCGQGLRYDGTFSGNLVARDGIFAALLKEHNIKVFTENELAEFEAYV